MSAFSLILISLLQKAFASLVLSLFCGSQSWAAASKPSSFQNQIVVREATVPIEAYQKALQGSPFLEPPHVLILRRLREDQLQKPLQDLIDESLKVLVLQPEKTQITLENLYQELAKEPRTRAIKNAMNLILQRMKVHATSFQMKPWLETIDKRLQSIGFPEVQGLWKKSILGLEIHQRLQQARKTRGLEDLQVFVNGQPLSLDLEVPFDFEGQWLFVSSSFRPKMIEGSWPKASQSLNETWDPWISGTCSEPVHLDPLLALTGKVVGLYSPDCEVVLHDPLHLGLNKFSFDRIKDESSWYQNPYWMTALVVGIGYAVLRSQNKRLEVRF